MKKVLVLLLGFILGLTSCSKDENIEVVPDLLGTWYELDTYPRKVLTFTVNSLDCLGTYGRSYCGYYSLYIESDTIERVGTTIWASSGVGPGNLVYIQTYPGANGTVLNGLKIRFEEKGRITIYGKTYIKK